ncbi:apolipoprotein N-acyltransferase [Minwuia thermotolerans]|uniref:Apolipoprotein N-acyltransferase n=2 Tax=Minwuia thermotolerans TaxID=2056226 RepID=A0A2M9G246_9PROT|nr:apolipoprotein N-acyltransferase [Minwuia thermotolerans]
MNQAAQAGRRMLSTPLRLAAAFLLGGLATLVFSPFDLPLAGFVAFTGLAVLLDRLGRMAGAFWTAWFFGWGHFIAGLYWTASAFLVEADKFAWMIPGPLLGLPAFLALFPAVAVTAAWRLTAPGPLRLATLAASWTLLEFARGHVLTGFPWNLAGYAFGFHPAAMQPAAWIGVYGLSFLAVLAFAAPALLFLPRRRTWAALALILPAVLAAGAGMLRLDAPGPRAEPVQLRIVQANIPQREKWRPDLIRTNFEKLVEMSLQPAEEGTPDLVIWPETAATFLLSRAEQPRQTLGAIAASLDDGRGGLVITGAPRVEVRDGREMPHNSALAIDPAAGIVAVYDKTHLVPFGEYLPLRGLLQFLGLEKLARGRGDFIPGPKDQRFDPPGLPPASVLICYEAIFPALSNRGERPEWLLNLTNDGWFGELTGPDQHFTMARFRAVEQGLPLVRAAGTGISAVVDARGRIVASLPLNSAGVIDAQLPAPAAKTFYAKTGNALVFGTTLAVLLLVAAGALLSRRNEDLPSGRASTTH